MKGVILAAGYGTRFLPGTKTVPKELFPLIDTPAIDYIVQEMAQAGIRDILVVTSRRKKSLEDYFDREVELESAFLAENAQHKLQGIKPTDLNVFFLRQQEMAGTGDALLLVEPFVRDEPFVVAYPDDLLIDGPSLSQQLIVLHERNGQTVLAAQELPHGDISRYGVMDVYQEGGVEKVRAMVEKPPPGTEPSRLVAFGRYLYTSEIFPALKSTRGSVKAGREFTQTDAINHLATQGKVGVCRFVGKLLDVGTKAGYLHAIIEVALRRPEFRDDILSYMREVLAREGCG